MLELRPKTSPSGLEPWPGTRSLWILFFHPGAATGARTHSLWPSTEPDEASGEERQLQVERGSMPSKIRSGPVRKVK